MSNHRGTRLYKAQKKFQSVFGFTLRESLTRFLCVLNSVANDGNLAFFFFPAAIFFGRGLFNCGLHVYHSPETTTDRTAS